VGVSAGVGVGVSVGVSAGMGGGGRENCLSEPSGSKF